MLPTEAYLQITGMFDLKGGAMLSLLLLVPAGSSISLQRHVVARRRYVTITGKGRAGASRSSAARWAGVLLLMASASRSCCSSSISTRCC